MLLRGSVPVTTAIDNLLDVPLSALPQIGSKRCEALASVGIETAGDLLQLYPRRYLDRSSITPVRQLREAMEEVTVVGTVLHVKQIGQGSRARHEMVIRSDDGGQCKGVWFRGGRWLARAYPTGRVVAFSGKPQKYGATFSFSHPDVERIDDEAPRLATGRIIALYPGGQAFDEARITSRAVRRLVYDLIKEHGLSIPEVLPAWLRTHAAVIEGPRALRAIHFPKSQEELAEAKRRLIFEELFQFQWTLVRGRALQKQQAGPQIGEPGALTQAFRAGGLPFTLTDSQEEVLVQIGRDLSSGVQMNRLVQGDVGSGKTVVAILAMLQAIDHGFQCAFMAPTEILAEQHAQTLSKWLAPLGITVGLLLGGQTKRIRQPLLDAISEGEVAIVVGTHAVIQAGVAFRSLGLAVVDEQHRFGVVQRAKLFSKGHRPHMLLMTATPIPRSLAMTLYGDLDVSIMRGMPKGRKPIETARFMERDRDAVWTRIAVELEKGHQAYVVYPLVEESEAMDLRDAMSAVATLKEAFPRYCVDVLHGRMSSAEKEDVMGRFSRGDIQVLVSTTVIEVGVDVPNATVMAIEHAERFGLSQLHQLRGRVGRGGDQGYCFLISGHAISAEGQARLAAMCQTTDGFKIAEMDLKLRGAGDFFGTRQSGLPAFKLADLVRDAEWIGIARQAALALADRDLRLVDPSHQVLKTWLSPTVRDRSGFIRVG